MIIKVTADDLMSLSSSLHAGVGEIDSRLGSMRAQVEGLVDSGWQGAASARFGQLFTEWDQGAAQLNRALEGIAQLLARASSVYTETEQSIARTMQA